MLGRDQAEEGFLAVQRDGDGLELVAGLIHDLFVQVAVCWKMAGLMAEPRLGFVRCIAAKYETNLGCLFPMASCVV
jgi:hypothetical protein